MWSIKQFIRKFSPPVIFRKLRQKCYIYLNLPYTAASVKIDFDPISLTYTTGDPVFSIPLQKIRYPGGLPFTYSSHHFMQYYKEGVAALSRFYQNHQPDNIFEMHYLSAPEVFESQPGNKAADTAKFRVPWLDNYHERKKAEMGLKIKDGNQAYGPASDQKIKLEARRLDYILYSIKKTGYKPEVFGGHQRGYFLMDINGEWVFLLREGMHRMAALAHLGHESIPVKFMQNYPRIIKQSDCPEWPLVSEGVISEKKALEIFHQYMATVSVSENQEV